MMRKVAAFAVLAALTNLAAVAALPWLLNGFIVHKLAARSGGYNRAVAWPRADAGARTIVRPSPDLLYTSCAFDVSERPVRITAPVQNSYVSISGFAANTDNFFAINDSQVPAGPDGAKHLDVILARQPIPAVAGARLVIAPSDRGLILFRSLITSDADLPRLLQFQAQQKCEPL